MKDEIKEILDSTRKIIKLNRENGFDGIIMLGDDIDKLLDYITNLQEENDRLNNQYDLMENSLDKKQEIIDKTLLYIAWHIHDCDELVNILQGSDEE